MWFYFYSCENGSSIEAIFLGKISTQLHLCCHVMGLPFSNPNNRQSAKNTNLNRFSSQAR